MVTEVISKENIQPHFNDIRYWINNGITHDAVFLNLDEWNAKNEYISSWYNIRNKNKNYKHIHQLNKW